MLRAVLGELVQTTDGKWITHPPTDCRLRLQDTNVEGSVFDISPLLDS